MIFISPIKFGRLTKEEKKEYIYTSDSTDNVIAPYDGIIYDVDTNKCDGFIKIKHNFGGQFVFSEICGVNKGIFVTINRPVQKGEMLGYCGGNELKLKISDGRDYLPICCPFFEKKTAKNKKEENKKEENKKVTTTTRKNPNKDDNAFNIWDATILAPFDFISRALMAKNKKKDDEELNEEIKRIKELLK
jgi:hypothetical protein